MALEDLTTDLNYKDITERVKAGQSVEDIIINSLRQKQKWVIEKPTVHQDMVQKIDGFRILDGKRESFQIKARITGNDILVDLFEPFFAPKDSRNQLGRDQKGKCDYYICLSKDQKEIRIIQSRGLQFAIDILFIDWDISKNRLPFRDKHGNELKQHTDRNNNRQKLVGFIQPKNIITRYIQTVAL